MQQMFARKEQMSSMLPSPRQAATLIGWRSKARKCVTRSVSTAIMSPNQLQFCLVSNSRYSWHCECSCSLMLVVFAACMSRSPIRRLACEHRSQPCERENTNCNVYKSGWSYFSSNIVIAVAFLKLYGPV